MAEYKNSQEFYQSHFNRLKTRFEDGGHVQVINETMETLSDLHDNFMVYGLDELTLIAGRLALMKAYLGEYASYENLKTNSAYVYKKLQRANKRSKATTRLEELGSKITQDSIEAEVIKMTIDEEQEHIFHQYYSDKVTNLFESLNWIMSSIKWRMEEKRSEQYHAKLYDQADTSPIM